MSEFPTQANAAVIGAGIVGNVCRQYQAWLRRRGIRIASVETRQ